MCRFENRLVIVVHYSRLFSFSSVQGLHPLEDPASSEGPGLLWRTRLLKDSAFVVFEGESFKETLLTSSAVGLRFQPPRWKWRSTPRDVAIFSLSFLFFGLAKNLGICEATKDSSGASSRNREQKEHLEELQTGTDFERRCDIIGL